MKVVQIVPRLNWRDAIGDDALAIDDALRGAGYQSEIMCVSAHESLVSRVKQFDVALFEPQDLAILHHASYNPLIGQVANLPCRRGILYHNITPAKFFVGYDSVVCANLLVGRYQIKKYAPKMDFAWGVSQYNCAELVRYGVDESRVQTLPILVQSENVAIEPDEALARQLASHAGTKLLFVGRVSPNKKHEDIIKVYWHVLRHDPLAKLYLVGNWKGMEKYYAKLKGFCADLQLADDQVVFTGSVSEEEKAAYLANSDVLVCMSEHEGFCVPLMEAMRSDLPIVAYAAAAVPETLGNNGLLFARKHYVSMAQAVLRVVEEGAFRTEVLKRQRAQLEAFQNSDPKGRLLHLVEQETRLLERA